MRVLADQEPAERSCVVTIGAFDGVHLGHQCLVDAVKVKAADLNCASAVVTFDRHPAAVLRPTAAPKLLTDLDQKLELLAATEIDYALVVSFDAARAAESAEDFIEEVLIGRLRTSAVVVGYDFRFGRARHGDVSLLRKIGMESGFEVEEFGAVVLDGSTVSSTDIRAALAAGEVETAARLLGRLYELRGAVVMGDRRGRELGYPTANVAVGVDVLVPGDGVYAGWLVGADGVPRKAAISVGSRPTFYEDGTTLVEAYALDFEGDLYGQHVKVRFVARIRSQERFDSLPVLIERIGEDVERTRQLIGRT